MILVPIGLWQASRRFVMVHTVELWYNLVFLGLLYGIVFSVYTIVYHDLFNERYTPSKLIDIIANQTFQIKGDAGGETYSILAYQLEYERQTFIACGCVSSRARSTMFSGRPQVYRYTLKNEMLQRSLLTVPYKYEFSKVKLPAWKCLENPVGTEVELSNNTHWVNPDTLQISSMEFGYYNGERQVQADI